MSSMVIEVSLVKGKIDVRVASSKPVEVLDVDVRARMNGIRCWG